MLIGGLQKFSLIDYPGKIAAVVFTQGCNFRCHYCHNPELVFPEQFNAGYAPEEVFEFLKSRQGQLDAVVICGGEPTLQDDLVEFCRQIKALGFFVKLDTNGTRPQVIRDLLKQGLLDYIAMDIKGPWEKYNLCAGVEVDEAAIKQSIEIIKQSGLEYEFRTTKSESFLTNADIEKINSCLSVPGHYRVQEFVEHDKALAV